MDNFFESLNHFLQQAYVYIPAVLAFISAFGIPSLVQIAKIVAAAKIYLTQASKFIGKTNETLAQVNRIADFVLQTLDDDAAFFEELAATTYNKKQKEAYLTRAASIRAKKKNAFAKIEAIKEDPQPKKKVKVKVKIKSEGNDAKADR